MKTTIEELRNLFTALGYLGPDKWTDERVVSKFKRLPKLIGIPICDALDTNCKSEPVSANAILLAKAIDDGSKIELVDVDITPSSH